SSAQGNGSAMLGLAQNALSLAPRLRGCCGMRKSAMNRLLLLLPALLAALAPDSVRALDPTRSLVQMYHRTFARDDGLPGAVTAIAQTTDGFLWIGTASGLYRFDGVLFER